MSAAVSLISLICSLALILIRSTAFHTVFIFLSFTAFAFTIAINPNLSDIQVYSDSFSNILNKEQYFETSFLLLLKFFQFFNFHLFYSMSVGVSASITYWILCSKLKRPDYLHLVIFLLLYTPQFSLAWRQLLATPAFTYIILNFLICYESPGKSKIMNKLVAVVLSSFHNATFISSSLIIVMSRYHKLILLFAIIVFLNFIYWGDYVSLTYAFITEKSLIFVYQINGASEYIDTELSTPLRSMVVSLKFTLLIFIFLLVRRSQGYARNIAVNILGALCILKFALSLLIWFFPSPTWGRINGLLVVVDYVVLVYGVQRYPILSLIYLIPTYMLGVTLHPYFR